MATNKQGFWKGGGPARRKGLREQFAQQINELREELSAAQEGDAPEIGSRIEQLTCEYKDAIQRDDLIF